MKVAFVGPAGTYTHQALLTHVSFDWAEPCVSIAEVFQVLIKGEVDAGFVPFENMIVGPVAETSDALRQYSSQVYIESAYLYEIVHAIGVLPREQGGVMPLSEVKAVMSHEQALLQCAEYLRQAAPQAETVKSNSTVAALDLVRVQERTDVAVIASAESLLQKGFQIISEQLLDSQTNMTRFVLLCPYQFTRG